MMWMIPVITTRAPPRVDGMVPVKRTFGSIWITFRNCWLCCFRAPLVAPYATSGTYIDNVLKSLINGNEVDVYIFRLYYSKAFDKVGHAVLLGLKFSVQPKANGSCWRLQIISCRFQKWSCPRNSVGVSCVYHLCNGYDHWSMHWKSQMLGAPSQMTPNSSRQLLLRSANAFRKKIWIKWCCGMLQKICCCIKISSRQWITLWTGPAFWGNCNLNCKTPPVHHT